MLGASQLVGYPSQFPSVSLLDWNTGKPNARFRVLQLLHENVGPGDRIVPLALRAHGLFAAAYVAADGRRKLLIINERNHDAVVAVAGALNATEQHVDIATGALPVAGSQLTSDEIHLHGLSVMVVQWNEHTRIQ